jgi:hypothetical protein
VLEVGEDEYGAGEVGDPAGADGDVLEGFPPQDQHGEASFHVPR